MKPVIKYLAALLVSLAFPLIASCQGPVPSDIIIDRDGILLKGKFYAAEGEGLLPTVILLQGFPGNEVDVIGLGKRLSQYGINALTFNYSGTHQSQGSLSFENSQADISSVYRFILNPQNIKRFKIDTSAIVLAGYSYGGGMAMTYTLRHPEIIHVITIAGNDWGAFFDEYKQNEEMRKATNANIERTIASGTARFEPGATPWEINENLSERLDSTFFLKRNARWLAGRDILIICGLDDDMAYDIVFPFYRALRKEKLQNVQINAFQDDHTFSKSRDDISVVMAKWIKSIPERLKE